VNNNNITIGIPTYKREFYVCRLLMQIAEQLQEVEGLIDEVIVISDASMENEYWDMALNLLKYSDVKIYTAEQCSGERYGLVGAHQKVLDLAQSPWILRLNDDVVLPHHFFKWIKHWVNTPFMNYGISWANGQHYDSLGMGFMFAGLEPGPDGYWKYKSNPTVNGLRNRIDFDKQELYNGQIGRPATRHFGVLDRAEFLYGAGFLYERYSAQEGGGYNPELFKTCAMHEEVNLAVNMRKFNPDGIFWVINDIELIDLNPQQNVEHDVSRRSYEQDEDDKEVIKQHEEELWARWKTLLK